MAEEAENDSVAGIRLQLVCLGLLRASEAIAWSSIFPYVFFMIKSFPEVDDSHVAFYAGMLIAVFTFCEFLSGMVWARISDAIGRKPTLLIGCVCGAITALMFGMSKSMIVALGSRAFGGLSNPNIGTVQTCAIELTTTKNQRARALSLVTMIRTSGTLIGPVLGGLLSDPATAYPSVFPQGTIWTEFPYLLPNLAVAATQLSTFMFAALILQEPRPRPYGWSRTSSRLRAWTLHITPGRTDSARGAHGYDILESSDQVLPAASAYELDEVHGDQGPATENKGSSRAFTLRVILQIVSVSMLAFHKVSFDAVMPTFLAMPPRPESFQASRYDDKSSSPGAGGFGYSTQKISGILLTQAMVGIIIQAGLIPFLLRKVAPLKAYRSVLGIYPFTYVFTAFYPRLPSPFDLVFVVLDLWVKVILSSTSYVCSAILIAGVTPVDQHLAKINGAAAAFGCLSRSIGPIVVGRLFSTGMILGNAGLAFWVLGGVSFLGAVESWFLHEAAGENI